MKRKPTTRRASTRRSKTSKRRSVTKRKTATKRKTTTTRRTKKLTATEISNILRRYTRTHDLHQTGTRRSVRKDIGLRAKKPGKRVSADGNVYYEYRKNRSDLKRKYRGHTVYI